MYNDYFASFKINATLLSSTVFLWSPTESRFSAQNVSANLNETLKSSIYNVSIVDDTQVFKYFVDGKSTINSQ
jgi:hypothetical protein